VRCSLLTASQKQGHGKRGVPRPVQCSVTAGWRWPALAGVGWRWRAKRRPVWCYAVCGCSPRLVAGASGPIGASALLPLLVLLMPLISPFLSTTLS
jgi:hypothetical protein